MKQVNETRAKVVLNQHGSNIMAWVKHHGLVRIKKREKRQGSVSGQWMRTVRADGEGLGL